jgi:hypothetical protein
MRALRGDALRKVSLWRVLWLATSTTFRVLVVAIRIPAKSIKAAESQLVREH